MSDEDDKNLLRLLTTGTFAGGGGNALSDAIGAPPVVDPGANALAQRGLVDKLLGLSGPRYQLWPERMVRSAATLPGDVASGAVPVVDPGTGRTNEEVISRTQDLAGLVMGGSMPAAVRGALGVGGGKLVQPMPKEFPPLYSAVEHAITNAPQNKMTAQQWAGWLKNQPGVKAEELQWLGLEPGQLPKEWTGAVPKEAVLEHVQGHGVKLHEIEKSGPTEEVGVNDLLDDTVNEFIDEHGRPPTPAEHERLARDLEEDMQENPHVYDSMTNENGPRYSEYQLPGGDNYRELLLTTPERKEPTGRYVVTDGHGFSMPAITKPEAQALLNKWQPKSDKPLEIQPEMRPDGKGYRSIHWDEPNVLVHMRMNDRELPGIGKSLHLEEVQSDWHQKGRKFGYRGDYDKSLQRVIDAEKAMNIVSQRMGPEIHRQFPDMPVHLQIQEAFRHPDYVKTASKYMEESARHEREFSGKSGGIIDAPFKSTWADLALKRAIAKAAREGYDAVSWTPGEQQAARYDLSKQIKALRYQKNEDGTYNLGANKDPGTWTEHHIADNVAPDKLADFVGKDVADKILKDQGSPPGLPPNMYEGAGKVLSGVDLKVGGEGMKAFYDKMLVDKANALAKKFGGKVEWQELPGEKVDYLVAPGHEGRYYVLRSRRGPEGEDHTEAVNGPNHSHEGFPSKEAAEASIPGLQAEDAKNIVKVPVLRLTPKLRDVATGRGFPLFTHGSPFMFTPVDGNPFEQKKEPRK